MSKSTILLTGATGFLGSYLLKELIENGHTVRALYRTSKELPWIPASILSQVNWVQGDVLDVVSLEEALKDVDTVIHSAAVVSFNRQERKRMYQVNVDGTANVVNMALEAGTRRFIHISSVAALGRTETESWVNEESKWEDNGVQTHYARSKFKAELHVWRGMAEGLEGLILNPSTILGYGDWSSGSCALFKQTRDGFPWYTEGVNGFVDVRDVARATRLAMEFSKTEERYLICAENWAFRELQQAIANGFEVKGPSRKATPLLLALAWRMATLKGWLTGTRPLLSKESARVGVSKTKFDNQKFLRDFPSFQYRALRDTIEEACQLYRQ
ncbi:MAG: SDR family NAD(P)-dependent oxidoreductase [Bacteroidota bacterium]